MGAKVIKKAPVITETAPHAPQNESEKTAEAYFSATNPTQPHHPTNTNNNTESNIKIGVVVVGHFTDNTTNNNNNLLRTACQEAEPRNL